MENKDSLTRMYEVILDRKENPAEGSYTCYLFEKGLDKILKKVGEECAETIIAAKNDGAGSREELCGEVCDLLYHVLVMCAEKGLDISEILAENDRRAEKIGNLKQMKTVDRNT